MPRIRAGSPHAWGWNSWSKFQGSVTDADVRGMADAMVASGMAKVGYVYVNIDGTWEGQSRDAKGNITTNDKFPDMRWQRMCIPRDSRSASILRRDRRRAPTTKGATITRSRTPCNSPHRRAGFSNTARATTKPLSPPLRAVTLIRDPAGPHNQYVLAWREGQALRTQAPALGQKRKRRHPTRCVRRRQNPSNRIKNRAPLVDSRRQADVAVKQDG
jgi:hypothetical protein